MNYSLTLNVNKNGLKILVSKFSKLITSNHFKTKLQRGYIFPKILVIFPLHMVTNYNRYIRQIFNPLVTRARARAILASLSQYISQILKSLSQKPEYLETLFLDSSTFFAISLPLLWRPIWHRRPKKPS